MTEAVDIQRSRRDGRAAMVFAGAGATWAAVHGLGLLGDLGDSTFLLLGTAAVIATVVGVRRHRPRMQWQWWVMCSALMLFLVGGAARASFGTLGDLSSGRSLIPDLITMPGYVLLGAGLIGLAGSRGRGWSIDLDAILDAIVASLAALALAWVFLINPVLLKEGTPFPVRILLASYPPLSVFLFAVTAGRAFRTTSQRPPAEFAILTAVSVMLVGDILYMLEDARLALLPLTVLDVPYALAYVAFGTAVLHPSMRNLTDTEGERALPPTRTRTALVGLALAIPALLTITRQNVHHGDRIALSSIVLALTGAAVWRLLRTIKAHARAQARLAHQATHDELTGLPNRLLARDRTAQALDRTASTDACVAVVFVDVDRFKLVNDTLGHSVGDDLLIAVAQRLGDNIRRRDLVARIGGDEFVMVFDGVPDIGEALYLAERIRCSFHAPFFVRGADIYASVSVGVAFANGRGPKTDAETLIREADTAMYQAKSAGRDSVAVFDASMRDRTVERMALEQDLRHALDDDQLHLHFQPVISLVDGRVEGFEALLRWAHPVLGAVPPDKFIPIAEDSGLIGDIGVWVLREACRSIAEWRRDVRGAHDLHVAVNVSARQLRDPQLIEWVEAALSAHSLPPQALCLELTESVLMDQPKAAAGVLGTLRSLGVRLSLDDFGTGYSSLAYLKRFPIDHVKIDRAFVEGLNGEGSSDESLIAAVNAMASALGMQTIAEGVETDEQRRRLVALGCGQAQGYLFSRPVPALEVPTVFRKLNGLDELAEVGVPR